MLQKNFLIFLKTSERECSLNNRHIYTENVPEKCITVKRQASGISGHQLFLLQAKQLSSDLGQWWQKLQQRSHPEPIKIDVAVSQFNWSKDEASDAALSCPCAVRFWQLIMTFLFSTLQVQNKLRSLQYVLANLTFFKSVISLQCHLPLYT